jgi:putative tricarboxylic transport membrane protein
MRKHDLISSAIWLLGGLIVTGYAPQFDLGTASAPGPGFMPFLAGIVWSFFALVTFLQALFNRSEERERIWADVSFPKLTFILIALLLYALLLETIGFLISTFLLIFVLIRFVGPRPWWTSLWGAGLTSVLSYLFFETWLNAQLPRGILGF